MRVILLARGGFKKEMSLGEFKPEIQIVIPPIVSYVEEPTDLVTYEKKTFYFMRDFIDEDNTKVLIYEEK